VEKVVYDPQDGQLLTGTLTDYALPHAADLPLIDTVLHEMPGADNPLGVKGIGESAATGATPAFVNAVIDALAPLGVEDIAPPLTPLAIWQAIAAARP
jgi:aerobic carbon-monoxide dehydrogenase large subunit